MYNISVAFAFADFWVIVGSAGNMEDIVETWPTAEVKERLAAAEKKQRCVLRLKSQYVTKDGVRCETYCCHRGSKQACADTHIYRYRSPLVSFLSSVVLSRQH